jgi:hypothetical protein
MTPFTIIHVLLSLVGIVTGLVVLAGLLSAKRLDSWTIVFLASTLATSLTGFGFPFERLLPSHIVGAISLVVLAAAIYSRYVRLMEARWRSIYVVTAVVALYLNVFVLVVQLFLKVPALNALAPTQSEPPFAIAQTIVLLIFAALGVAAVKRFRMIAGPVRGATSV